MEEWALQGVVAGLERAAADWWHRAPTCPRCLHRVLLLTKAPSWELEGRSVSCVEAASAGGTGEAPCAACPDRVEAAPEDRKAEAAGGRSLPQAGGEEAPRAELLACEDCQIYSAWRAWWAARPSDPMGGDVELRHWLKRPW